jgi:hypothetical protein
MIFAGHPETTGHLVAEAERVQRRRRPGSDFVSHDNRRG